MMILAIISCFSLNFLVIDKALAADYDVKKTADELAEDSPLKTPEGILKILETILKYVYTIFFVVAIIYIILAAFNFLTAQGDPEKIKSAKSQILWACVAIAIGLISVGAAKIIYGFISGATGE